MEKVYSQEHLKNITFLFNSGLLTKTVITVLDFHSSHIHTG
jgi:hypothetical protein